MSGIAFDRITWLVLSGWILATPHHTPLIVTPIFGLLLALCLAFLLKRHATQEGFDGAGYKKHIRGTQAVTLKKLRKVCTEPGVAQVDVAGVPMPASIENLHILLNGATGSGKSVLLRSLVFSALRRGDRMVIVDPNGDLYGKFGRDYDVLLNPYDQRSEGWSFFNEVRAEYDWKRLALSIVPLGKDANAEEWNGYARLLLRETARKLSELGTPSIEELFRWTTIASDKDLRTFLSGTLAESLFAGSAEANKALTSSRFVLSKYLAEHQDDYYSRDGAAAQWQGKAAQALGLTGTVDQEAFLRALRGNFGPEIKLSRSIRLDSKARGALDITFSPPKSISIQALVGKDASVIEAHDHAVTKALEFIESELVRARQTEGGVTTMERTGNAAIAKFRHETARPTAGAYSDPQLHTHALLMNITQRADGRWVAVCNDDIFRLKSIAESVYHAELASGLERVGHTLRYEDKSFELAHISRPQIEGLSKRSEDVNAELAALGLDRQTASRALKQTLTLKTRQGKAPAITRDELQKDWERQAKALGIDFSAAKQPVQKTRELSPEAAAWVADECLKWAIKHHTERESVMDGKTLLKTVLLRSHGTGLKLPELKAAVRRSLNQGHLLLGTLEYRLARDCAGQELSRSAWITQQVQQGMSPKHAQNHVRQSIARGELIPTGARYTTQVTREREKRILQIERAGRGQVTPILPAEAACLALTGRSLKPGQRAAAELILATADRFVGVQGLAGTGKSHMLAQVKATAESAGYTVKAVASYGKQIEALRELGIQARTVASVLEARQKNRFKLDAKTVLVIDEAGVVPARIMERLMKMAEADGARVVLLGDTGQTKAIEAGRPFHQLQAAGMATALMGDIRRQKTPELKEAVELAAKAEASASLSVLDRKLQAVRTVKDDGERYDQIAMILSAALLALAWIDLESRLLPDALTLPLAWAGLLVNLGDGFTPLPLAVLGAVAGYGFLWIVFHACRLCTGREGMGYGDFKLLAALGAWFGIEALPTLLLGASLAAMLGGGTLILIGRAGRDQSLPFGPYLALAGVAVLLQ
eukprot:scaffold43.g4482.t1